VGARVAGSIRKKIEQEGKDGGEVMIAAVMQHGGGLDARVVRAACFAHDLGHPPFGHVAEHEINRMLCPPPGDDKGALSDEYRLDDGFEGNAQSFRIVTKLAFREQDAAALDLTRATLRALLKYPWLRHENLDVNDPFLSDKRFGKWGAYDSEREIFLFARGDHDKRNVVFHGRQAVELRSIEAQVMDWADDITYAVHDVEDFFRAGLIPLHELGVNDKAFDAFLEAVWPSIERQVMVAPEDREDESAITFENARAWIFKLRPKFPKAPYAGRRADREALHVFAAELIRTATSRFDITEDGLLLPKPQQFALIEIFKKMTWYYVIQRPGVGTAQRGQALLVNRLITRLLEWSMERNVIGTLESIAGDAKPSLEQPVSSFDPKLFDRVLAELREFPARLVDYLAVAFDPDPQVGCSSYSSERRVSRAVVDYVVSLTEAQAVALDARLNGFPAESMLEKWISA
jgi:dGTPase